MSQTIAHCAILLSMVVFVVPAKASLISLPPFQGGLTETWESYPNFVPEDGYLPNPSQIMGGNALISSPFMAVFEVGVVDCSLGSSGLAQPADAVKGMVINHLGQSAEVIFLQPIIEFGAHWGAYTHPIFAQDPTTISVSFFDTSNVLIGIESFLYSRAPMADGLLEWHGWSSTTPIKRITYSGDGVVTDGLQANLVPEPAAAMLLALGALMTRRITAADRSRNSSGG